MSRRSPALSGKDTAYFDTSTADEYDQGGDGYEAEESVETQALALARPSNAQQLQKELEYIDLVMSLGDQVRELQQETKFLKLRELIESSEFPQPAIADLHRTSGHPRIPPPTIRSAGIHRAACIHSRRHGR